MKSMIKYKVNPSAGWKTLIYWLYREVNDTLEGNAKLNANWSLKYCWHDVKLYRLYYSKNEKRAPTEKILSKSIPRMQTAEPFQ